VSQKNYTVLACYNFDVHQPILIIFVRNATENKQSNYYILFPLHLTNASALPGRTQKHENCIFSLKCCVTAFTEFNQSLLYFFSFFICNSYSHCCRLPKSCNQLSSDVACWGHRLGEMKLRVVHSGC